MILDLDLDRLQPLHLQITAHLRRQIESGALKPGQSLPSTLELGRQWGVHYLTVQKAMSRLKKTGLVRRTPMGTYVAPIAKPVSLAIVFGPVLTDETGHFYRAMAKALRDLAGERGWPCHSYDGLSRYNRAGFKRMPAYRLFHEDHVKHDFNAVITVGVDEAFWRLVQPNLSAHAVRYGVPSPSTDIAPDFRHFAWTAVEHLAGLGLRRIVYFRVSLSSSSSSRKNNRDIEGWTAAVRRFKIASGAVLPWPPRYDRGHWETNVYRLADRHIRAWRKAHRWPEAIVISDDVAARALALALIRNRVAVPDRLRVLTWANEGIAIHYGIPVIRYLISPAEIARRLMEILDKRLAGESPRGLPIAIRGRIVEEKTTIRKATTP